MRKVYVGHILTIFKESAARNVSKRRVFDGLETLQANYIRLRESFKCSIDSKLKQYYLPHIFSLYQAFF